MVLRFDHHRPRSLAEACALAAALPEARFLAGGTDLLVRMKGDRESPKALVSLRSVSELIGVRSGEPLRIGAMTPLADLLEHDALRERLPVLLEAIARVGSVQIRNVATLGGNLCRSAPCADTAPPLLVLDARLRLTGPGGEREIPLADFFTGAGENCLGPAEILTEVYVPAPPPHAAGAFLKRGRVAIDLALVNAAALVALDPADGTCRVARVAVGSVAPTPRRLPAVEEVVTGQPLSADLLARVREIARENVAPITDVRATADYRRHLTGVLVERALIAAAQRSQS